MNEIYEWIKNIVIYMILNTIIMNLLGNSSYKKYVSIVSGMILVLIVVSPIMRFLKIDEKMDFYIRSNDFTVEASAFKNDLQRMEEKQMQQIFAEYKDRIKEQVKVILSAEELYLVSFDITFNLDTQSSTFGEIQRMDITATGTKSEEEKSSKIIIEEVEISDIKSALQKEKEVSQKVPSPAEINIKIKLSDFYNIGADNINISIQGG
ncbi:stage III sporulation protein AF [Mobilitalea sibirica]|uniref:Stage III sporulation protein AF n=1 Tax=Mobilitalea sibirica TaxID=1462919 RepID=A0A8J7H5K8_9FIRM|nr:stage III sporulation protein AF [Mobilitalea sibirica]MBH1940201.1 stage III sporulation protein AF [Mobilitalea sibirica]